MKKLFIQFLTILIKPFYGTGIGNYFPFKQINTIFKKYSNNNKSIIKTVYGFNMNLESGKIIDDEIIFKGIWEENVSKIISENLNEGDCFIDIGANIGYYSLLSSLKVGNKGKVISFEPFTINYNKLVSNVKMNNFTNVVMNKLGVGESSDKFEIFYDEINPGATSIVKRDNHNELIKEIIEVVSLDEFLQDKKVDFIKMDIEGFEYEAILGMKEILTSNKNIKLLFEYSPIIYKNKEKDFVKYSINILQTLLDYGFKLFHIEHDGSINKIQDLDKYFELINSSSVGQSDIFCIKQ